MLNTTVLDSQRLHSDIKDKGLSTLFLRSIMNAFKMIPKDKEPTSPSLELTPLLKNRIMKLRSSNKTIHSTSGPRGPRMNARRSTSTQMLEMRAPKKKMRNITDILSAVRALRGSTLLHFEQSIRGAMTIGKNSLKNEPIRMRFPFAMESQGSLKMNLLAALPNRRRHRKFLHKNMPISHANDMLKGLERLVAKPPNTLAVRIKNASRRNIKVLPKKLNVFKKKSNRANTTQFGAAGKKLTDTRSPAVNKVSLPIRKGGTRSRKRVMQQVTFKN